MFRKILIANRGEIACRVIATARRMGIATVTVFSEADRNARHVQMANEAISVGAPPAAESYLSAEKILAAANSTGVEAIHPGYGFLSENPDFAEAVAAEGLVFVGPPASAIRAMGLKDAAKHAMEEAGIPVVPGYHGDNQNEDFLAREADRIGYPVLIKARAGGGGKGMRLVETPKDFVAALAGAQREAQASFGDPVCVIEKYIARPRHIEIQILADSHGNVVHLFERDCSLQRRHQKVIEEAPAPGMTGEIRKAMGRAATDAARAIGYQNAGTVEFIVDTSNGLRADGFWFMEMNTRLQVEHPVTEAITGLDLVELQLRIAAGEALPFVQKDLAINGHAFEARIYAEDAGKGFLPTTGTLDFLSFPPSSAFERSDVRIDSGVSEGDEISLFYDPMIAKLIVHGSNRHEALHRLSAALTEFYIAGTITNVPFLSALARHHEFTEGGFNTGLIGRDMDKLVMSNPPADEVHALAVLAALGFFSLADQSDPWASLQGWRHWSQAEDFSSLDFQGERLERKIVTLAKHHYRIEGGPTPVELGITAIDGRRITFSSAGRRRQATVFQKHCEITVFLDAHCYTYLIPDPLDGEGEAVMAGDAITAPMPGLVKRLNVHAGQNVMKGEALIILEAMKMEHTLSAPRDGQIAEVYVAESEQVHGDTILLILDPEATNG